MQGLTQELSQEGACDRAIFPDSSILITRCAMVGNLNVDGVSRFIFLYIFLFEKPSTDKKGHDSNAG